NPFRKYDSVPVRPEPGASLRLRWRPKQTKGEVAHLLVRRRPSTSSGRTETTATRRIARIHQRHPGRGAIAMRPDQQQAFEVELSRVFRSGDQPETVRRLVEGYGPEILGYLSRTMNDE